MAIFRDDLQAAHHRIERLEAEKVRLEEKLRQARRARRSPLAPIVVGGMAAVLSLGILGYAVASVRLRPARAVVVAPSMEPLAPVPTWDEPLSAPSSDIPFDRAAAQRAIGAVDVQHCAKGATGAGHVRITFSSSGQVTDVHEDAGPFIGTPTATCVTSAYRQVHVPPFSGGPVQVGKSFSIH
jgi:hypothetical protein